MSTYDDASLIYYPSGYKASKAYSLKPTDGSGDLTFTRASTATRVNESGLIEEVAANVPRLDNSQGGCSTLLLEPQRTNLVTYSSEFDNAAWSILTESTSTMSITPNYATAENGLSASRLVATRPSTSFLSIIANFVSNTNTATKSLWIKNNNSGSVNISISDQAITVTDTWQRYEITNNYPHATIGLRYASADLNCDISIAGFQFELGSYSTSYIPTTTTAVTRTQDTATKGSIDSLIGQTEGTIFVDMNIDAWDSSSFYFGVYGGGNEIYFACVGTGFLRFKHFGGGTTLAQIQQSGFALGRHKLAARYKNNDWAFYVDGVLIGVDTSGTFSGLIGFCSLGYSSPAAYPSNAKYNSAMVFPTALSNAELATLTTL